MVAEAANKLKEGLNLGRKKDGKKQLKYTIAHDGYFPCMAEIFTNPASLSEDNTIPKVVFEYAQKDKNSIFVFDRGVQCRKVFCGLSINETPFISRLNLTQK